MSYATPSQVDLIINSLSYIDRSRVRVDVMHLLVQIPSLKPLRSSFTQNNGVTSELLQISGTIPIFYQSNRYNIPLSIWVLEQYPLLGPIVYITPTPDMMIRPSHRHVGSDGKVYLPYLAEWNRNQPRSNIMELIGILSSTFGSDPPVYKKPPEIPIALTALPYVSSSSPSILTPTVISSTTSGSGSIIGEMSNMAASSATSKNTAISTLTRKIQENMQTRLSIIGKSIDEQLVIQKQLEKNSRTLDSGIVALEAQKKSLEDGARILEEKKIESIDWLKNSETLESRINVNDILEPADSLSRQLLDVVSESATYEDTLYHLNNSLQNGTISFEVFIQASRRLSEKQFLSMALAQKIAGEQKKMLGL